MLKALLLTIICLAVISSGCGLPSTGRIQKQFQKEHAGYSVLLVTNQVESRHAYYHIEYRHPTDERVHEDVWHYWHAAEAWAGVEKQT